jgi:hypothetical protein
VENEGKVALIHRALNGGKSAGTNFRNHLRSRSCPADPDVWMRSAIKSDGTEVHEYVFLYIDDALSIGVEAESILRKEKSIGPRRSSESGRTGQWSQGLGLQFFSLCEGCSSECGGLYCQGRDGSFRIKLKLPCAPLTDRSLMSQPS